MRIGHNGGPHLWGPRATPQSFQDILGASLKAFIDAEDNTKITNVSGFCSAYADVISGTSYAQGTSSSRPAVVAGPNSRQVLRFDGVDDYLEFAGIPAGVPTGANPSSTIFIGWQNLTVAASTTSRTIVIWGAAANTANRQLRRERTGALNAAVQRAGDGATDLGSGLTSGDFFGPHMVRGIVSGTTLTASMDGALSTSTACVPATGATRFRVGANNSASPGGFALMDLSALLIVDNAALSQATIDALLLAASERLIG